MFLESAVICLSQQGWDILTNKISELKDTDKQTITQLINQSTGHKVRQSNHCFYYYNAHNIIVDSVLLFIKNNVDPTYYCAAVVDQNNCEHHYGYWQSPFNVQIYRNIHFDYFGSVDYKLDEIPNTLPSGQLQQANINNYTCKLCANTRLNVSEKSCWKCGTKI